MLFDAYGNMQKNNFVLHTAYFYILLRTYFLLCSEYTPMEGHGGRCNSQFSVTLSPRLITSRGYSKCLMLILTGSPYGEQKMNAFLKFAAFLLARFIFQTTVCILMKLVV